MKRSILVLSIILSVIVSNLAPFSVSALTDDPWEYACPANELPLLDTAKMSDEDFFGKWEDDRWKVEGKLNYDYADKEQPDFKPLKYVEEMVKEGDYESAKKELLAYYRT